MVSLLCVLGATNCSHISWQRGTTDVVTPPNVEFCNLVTDPEKYANRAVRTKAIFIANEENSALYSPECSDVRQYAWADFDPAYRRSDKLVLKKFDELDCKQPPCISGRISVSIEGRFESTSSTGYGHLGAYRFRFVIVRIINAEVLTTKK